MAQLIPDVWGIIIGHVDDISNIVRISQINRACRRFCQDTTFVYNWLCKYPDNLEPTLRVIMMLRMVNSIDTSIADAYISAVKKYLVAPSIRYRYESMLKLYELVQSPPNNELAFHLLEGFNMYNPSRLTSYHGSRTADYASYGGSEIVVLEGAHAVVLRAPNSDQYDIRKHHIPGAPYTLVAKYKIINTTIAHNYGILMHVPGNPVGVLPTARLLCGDDAHAYDKHIKYS